MPRRVLFGNFPFPPDETVYLHWLGSPSRDGKTKSWSLPVSFRPSEGPPQRVSLPWGSLPSLRLGQFYQGGQPRPEVIGETYDVVLETQQPIYLRTAIQAVRREHYRLFTQANLDEPCFSFHTQEGYRLIVPATEIARACFAHNRVLAQALLRPNVVQQFVHSFEFEGDTLNIWFLPKMRSYLRNKAFIRQVARLLSLPAFLSAWESVSRHLAEERIPWTREMLPDLRPEWRVRGILHGNALLVLEILKFTLADTLPVRYVGYDIAGQRIRHVVDVEDTPTVIEVPTPGTTLIDTSGQTTSRSKPVRRLNLVPPPLQDVEDLVLRLKEPESEPKRMPKLIIKLIDGDEEVGLTQEGVGGKLRPGEFDDPKTKQGSRKKAGSGKPTYEQKQQEELTNDVRFAWFMDDVQELGSRLQTEPTFFRQALQISSSVTLELIVVSLKDPSILSACLIELEEVSSGSASTLIVSL